MKRFLASLFLLCCTVLSAQKATITGQWKTIDDETGKAAGIVEIFESHGKIYGRVLEILNSKDRARTCTKCEGEDKNKPILGMVFIKGLVKEADEYYGKILDPKHGKIYKCVVKLEEKDKLKVRGYLGITLIGRTQYWYRMK